jgi:8-oxo-dGTP diphosphatase
MSFTYPYPRPSVTVDVVVFGYAFDDPILGVLLIKRGRPGTPFEGCWAIPGGFVNDNEDLDVAARRELREETHLDIDNIFQVGAFGKPGRDPRGHVVSVAYVTVVNRNDVNGMIQADDDAKEVQWWPTNDLPDLAFDHADILRAARERLDFLADQVA